MKNKVIVAVIIILIMIILGVVYYIKNVMIVPDKNGMVFEPQNKTNVEESYKKGDE